MSVACSMVVVIITVVILLDLTIAHVKLDILYLAMDTTVQVC